MVIDGRLVGNLDVLEADLCVVGAGPAGISLAIEVARAGGTVCLLESGGRLPDRATDRLSDGARVGYWYYPLPATRGRAFGGTSLRWAATPMDRHEGWRARPLEAVDFERREEIPFSGWPFGYPTLRPFYERAQSICRLGPFDYELERWQTPDASPLSLDGDISTAIFQHGHDDFGSYFDEVSRSERVRLVLNSTAIEIVTDGPTGAVTEVVAAGRRPARFSVKARFYVLATGGIDNARLLLVSSRSQPAGLGNGEGLVGRFFMERLTARTGFIVPTKPDFFERIAYYAQRRVDGTTVGAVLCSSEDAVRREGLLQCAFHLVPDSRAGCSDGMRGAANVVRALRRRPIPPGIARQAGIAVRGLADVARARLPRRQDGRPEVVALRVQAEQAPNPDSRVSLDRARDAFGLPKARLDWRIGERDRWSIRRAQDLLDAELRARGLGRVEQRLGDESAPVLFLGTFHHMGTTRMHDSPREGVVDRNCRVHGIENLFVTGASVFPTSGFANPTLTVVALALRLADHVKERLAL